MWLYNSLCEFDCFLSDTSEGSYLSYSFSDAISFANDVQACKNKLQEDAVGNEDYQVEDQMELSSWINVCKIDLT